ncbi:MAG: DUF4476 domain-containing protein [Bacteroidota bacterium]
MKNLIITLFAVFITSLILAQNSNIIIFTNVDDAKFIAKINGMAQNEKYESSININGVEPKPYKLFIQFESADVKTIDKTIDVAPYMEYTLEIKEKSDASQKAGKFGKTIARDLTFRDRDTSGVIDLYTLDVISMNPLRKPNADSYSTKNAETSGDTNTNLNTDENPDTKTSYTTTTNVSGNPNTSTANMNVNTGGANISLNVSGSTTGTYNESHTTTTTTTTGTTEADHYIMQGYSGTVGCPWPMQPNDFSAAKGSVASKSFEDSKLTVAKQVVNANCLFADQVREIMMLFSFEDSKLDFAKYSWHKTYDRGNYFKVNDAFEFESSIDELNNYILQNP